MPSWITCAIPEIVPVEIILTETQTTNTSLDPQPIQTFVNHTVTTRKRPCILIDLQTELCVKCGYFTMLIHPPLQSEGPSNSKYLYWAGEL